MSIIPLISDGRIGHIIYALKSTYKKSISQIPTESKLDALCESLLLSYSELDDLIYSNSEVMRTVKGHAFEAAFQYILLENGYQSKDVGGDTDIDLQVKDVTLQLKTPYVDGSNETQVKYKTHKTHGAKSENESLDYYHNVKDFADYFVGLISYNPFLVFIVPKEKLPKLPSNKNYIKSPFKLNKYSLFDRGYNQYVNNFKQIGVEIKEGSVAKIFPNNDELLPKTSHFIGLTTSIIVDTILKEENFRIWDMSIRGFSREFVFKKALENLKIDFKKPQNDVERKEKSDLMVQFPGNNKFDSVQIKGLSVARCTFQGLNSRMVVETQLTRGRINDHPTQSRLYKKSDFDYLVLAIDPGISYKIYQKESWLFYKIPSERLMCHKNFPNRYNSYQYFTLPFLDNYLFCSYT